MYRRAMKAPAPSVQEPKIENPMIPLMTLTVDEVAKELHISRPTAYELVKQDDFPALRIGQRIVVNRAGLQRWLDRKSEQPLDAPAVDAA